ncbi:MAG: SRPBCC domain-containing protein [Phenylobacterium sp.]|uniref:SRPBCC domain-containing protein n=1 Tax=Phenylobacterium sp. TaxID=1871053 RepID=UPI002736153D|nr:SRPBCC domain-containing protein [Phenylobacterium sp.]MDP3748924.1 SRPBCC domain-containing protein [Phenylobacterium sp.]
MTQPTAQVSKTIAAPANDVWDALIKPEIIKTYMFGADVQSDWKVGSPIRIEGEYNGKAFRDKGEVRSFEPQRRLSYTHWSQQSGEPDIPDNYHVVTYELEPAGDGKTKVTLTQSNLNGQVKESDLKMRPEYEKTWASILDGLEEAVAH